MPSDRRKEKLASLIQEEAAQFIEEYGNMPPGTVLTVTQVDLSPDGAYAEVRISLFPTARVGSFLEKMKYLQSEFNRQMKNTFRMKKIPSARFMFDDAEIKREHIEKLLEEDKK